MNRGIDWPKHFFGPSGYAIIRSFHAIDINGLLLALIAWLPKQGEEILQVCWRLRGLNSRLQGGCGHAI